jgi:RNA polymerase sigma factor (sigma-70 family)
MTTTPDDQALLTAWITHTDEAAFQALVGRYAGLVHGTCRRIAGDGQLADDAAQATFLILWRKASGLSANVILAGWLHGVARHAALKVVRGEVRRKQREYQAAKESADMPIEPGWTEIAPLLDEALSSLGVAEREAVTLRFLAGRTWEETAATLGVARNTAEKRVGRALERLRDLFARRGVTISASALAAVLTTAPAEAAGPALGFAQHSPEATRLAGETIQAMTGKGWLPLAWAAGVVLALGAGLAWTLAAAPPRQAEHPPVPVAAVEPPRGLPPPDTTRLVVRQGHSSLRD